MGAQTILKMIEEVSPDDTVKLDEIDARVWCWINDVEYLGSYIDGDDAYHDRKGSMPAGKGIFYIGDKRAIKYTRSRDALKAIRTEGWWFSICPEVGETWMVHFTNDDQDERTVSLPTEELAELHAIIQAIDYERKNK